MSVRNTSYDQEHNKVHYARITVLNLPEDITNGEIQGIITGGTINVNGSSSIRRTGSLSMIATGDNNNIVNVDNIISINKRIKVEVGLQNDKINGGNITWFNLGHYVITGASINHALQGTNISLNIKDYMALLNGEVGGIIPTGLIHSPIKNEKGELKPVEFEVLIKSLLRKYTDINVDNSIIELYKINPDTGKSTRSNLVKINNSLYLKNTVRWAVGNTLYADKRAYGTNGTYYLLSLTQPINFNPTEDLTFNYNDNIGYKLTKFTYPSEKELSSSAGESVVSVLDKIKGALGNFEYFFDVDGVFHFQEIQNGINQGSAEINLSDAISDKYLSSIDGEPVYTFDENIDFLISCVNNPQYSAIKNDITLWGQRDDKKTGLRYRLVIDNKPTFTKGKVAYNSCEIYKDDFGVKRAKKVTGKTTQINLQDWRQYLYLDYILNPDHNSTPYDKELAEELPKIMDIETGIFYAAAQGASDDQIKVTLNSMNYFLDMLDPNELTGSAQEFYSQLTVSKIGRREKVINDKDVNTLFNPDFPDVVYIELGTSNTSAERTIARNNGWTFAQVPATIATNIEIGSAINSAYDGIRAILSDVVSYNESVSLSMVPIYHLDANEMIKIEDAESCTSGYFTINSMSLPLAYNGNMTLTARKINSRI